MIQGLRAYPTNRPAGAHKYLIETNPALTNLKQFMSSDYLLGNLGYDTDMAQKRLGDGFYEQRLIREANAASPPMHRRALATPTEKPSPTAQPASKRPTT